MLYHLMRTLGLLPRCFHYGMSNLLAFLLHRVVRYRVKVVRENIEASFPELSKREHREIESKFYKHLTDLMVETIMYTRFGKREMVKYAKIINPEVLDKLHDEGYPMVFVMMGHTGNWEWFSGSPVFFEDTTIHELYKPLKGAMEYAMRRTREHLGSICVDKNRAPIAILGLKRENKNSTVVFIADQIPSVPNAHVITEFMGRETPVHSGGERLARRLKIPMLFLDIYKIKRGVYRGEFHILEKYPQEREWGEVSAQFINLIEERIRRQPPYWLWSHRRWKLAPELVVQTLGEEAVTFIKKEKL